MKSIVIGTSGQVGRALIRVLERNGIEATGTYLSRPFKGGIELDVRDGDAVQRCLDTLTPDVVFVAVNTLGGSDRCEVRPDEAQALNVAGTRNVATAATRYNCRVIYYSSDSIFDGKDGPYSEDHEASPVSVYGRTKSEAEQVIMAEGCDYLIIRTTTVFGWDRGSRNFAMQVWERLGARNSMSVANDQWANPTLVDYLAEVSVRLVQASADGIFNVGGKDWMSRAHLAKALARTMMLDPELVIPVPTSELGQRAPRLFNGGLKTNKLQQVLGTRPMNLSESLKRFRRQFLAHPGSVRKSL